MKNLFTKTISFKQISYKVKIIIVLSISFIVFCMVNVTKYKDTYISQSFGNILGALLIPAIISGIIYLFKKDKALFFKHIYIGVWIVLLLTYATSTYTPKTPDTTFLSKNEEVNQEDQDYYINKEKHFSVQFPSIATVTENLDGSVSGELESPHKAKIMVATFGNSDAIQKDMQIPAEYTIQKVISLEDRTVKLLEAYKSQFQAQGVIVKNELSTVDSTPAYLVELGNSKVNINTLSYSFLKNGHYFEVAVVYSSDDEDYIVPLFNTFIDSFKVLDNK